MCWPTDSPVQPTNSVLVVRLCKGEIEQTASLFSKQ